MREKIYKAECGCKGTATRWTDPCPQHKAEEAEIHRQAQADYQREMQEKHHGE